MLGWGMGNIKAPGYFYYARKMSFLPVAYNVSFDSIDALFKMLLTHLEIPRQDPSVCPEKEISIILLVANLATSIVCRQNTKVTRLFLAIFFFTQELNLSCIFHIVVVLHVFFSLHEI
jgi:hypothetical protein